MSQRGTASGSPLSPGGRSVAISRGAAAGSGLPPLTSLQLVVKLVVKLGWAPACGVEVAVNRFVTPKGTGALETGVGLVVGSLVEALSGSAPPPEIFAVFSICMPSDAVTLTLIANASMSPTSTLSGYVHLTEDGGDSVQLRGLPVNASP